jgi:cytochrome bd-type quinol oxidase subunit 1
MLFASVGMALPVMLLIVERRWIRGRDPDALALTKTWSKATTAVLFAIGAVSGTALSFELGLLWPGFMALAGPLIFLIVVLFTCLGVALLAPSLWYLFAVFKGKNPEYAVRSRDSR